MDNTKQINLLKQVLDFIEEMQGLDEMLMQEIGITVSECLEPTPETVVKLHEYNCKLDAKDQELEIERLDFNL